MRLRLFLLLRITCCLLLLVAPSIARCQTFSKLDEWLQNNVSDMGGRAVLMVYNDNKVIYVNAVNEMNGRQELVAKVMARRQGKQTLTEDYSSSTRLPIASCSKWLSAALVMTFVDEGKLKLTDTVGRFLPVLSLFGKGGITITQCLSHTTAIKVGSFTKNIEEMKEANSMDEAMQKIAVLAMEGEPGKVFHYSNIGLQIAAAVLEKISGKTFQQLFAERIAQPLEMKNTDFGKSKFPLAAGGALSTTEDYMNFLVMILNKGAYKGKRILSEKSIAAMQVNRINTDVKIAYSPEEAGTTGYGFGEWIMDSEDKTKSAKYVSSPGLFGSFPLVDNNKKYCAFLMTYYIKSKGRHERYKELKGVLDSIIK